MPGADGLATPTGNSGLADGLSVLGSFGGVVDVLVLPGDHPMTPAEFDAWSAAHPPPVANVIVSYDSAGHLVTTNTSPPQAVSPPPVDIEIATPPASGVLVFASLGQSNINGGAGDDTLQGGTFADALHGGDGNDLVLGGSAFDDINGNKGNDTIDGGSGGSDWLLGGQGNDLITAHHGSNLIFGNLGDDTLNSGDGQDVVRGGQGDDSIVGGSGSEFISGDRGNDTMSGGAGADIFHASQDAGIDRVLDFHLSEGDRVQLDPGTTYTVSQVGADTVIDMGSGAHMILVSVQMSTLTPGWIFGF